MKINLIFTTLIFLLVSCTKSVKKEIVPQSNDKISSLIVPTNTIDKSKLDYNKKTSVWSLNGKAFSGYALSYFQDSTLMQSFGILDGKKQNEAMDWYPDGHLKQSANYHNGKLHGEKKTWSVDSKHVLVSHLNYYLGKAHGFQKNGIQQAKSLKFSI